VKEWQGFNLNRKMFSCTWRTLERREQNHNQPFYIYPDVDIKVHFTALQVKAFEKVLTVSI